MNPHDSGKMDSPSPERHRRHARFGLLPVERRGSQLDGDDTLLSLFIAAVLLVAFRSD